MALSLVGTPTTMNILATTVASAFPTGYTVVANDLAVLCVVSKPGRNNEANIPATPPNWTLLGSGLGGVTGNAADLGRIRITIYYKELQAGDTAPTLTQTATTGNWLGPLIYVLRRDAAGTYELTLHVLSEATSSLTWSEPTVGVPNWTATPHSDHLLLLAGATSDAVTGFSAGTLTATGLTLGAITENVDVLTTAGDDGRVQACNAAVTAGPPTTVATRGITLTGVASTGAMGLVRVRHVPAAQSATVTPNVVAAAAAVGVPVVSTPSSAAVFTVGLSRVGSSDQLGLGASTQVWATLTPVTVARTVSFPTAMLWGPPSGLVATVLSSNTIRLTWNPVLAADGYDIERDGVVIATLHPSTTYDDTGRNPSTLYTYRVRARR